MDTVLQPTSCSSGNQTYFQQNYIELTIVDGDWFRFHFSRYQLKTKHIFFTQFQEHGSLTRGGVDRTFVASTFIVVLKLEFLRWAVQTCREGGDDIRYFFFTIMKTLWIPWIEFSTDASLNSRSSNYLLIFFYYITSLKGPLTLIHFKSDHVLQSCYFNIIIYHYLNLQIIRVYSRNKANFC